MSLTRQIAVVTGASRGIGRAIAVELNQRGASVVVNYARDTEGAAKTAEIIQGMGGVACLVQADISDSAQVEKLIRTTVDTLGSVDILVNNAGITRDRLIAFMSEADWDLVLETNLKGAFECSRKALAAMIPRHSGRIINITSVVGITGNAGQTNYSASKAGLIGFTQGLAREVGQYHITVNAVAAGYVPTNLTEDLPAGIKEKILQAIPLGHGGTPEDIAHAVAFLASEDASYITGQVLNVDGGMVMD
jgi:3-oxoacyl-[acyl-carrier protein] reductase